MAVKEFALPDLGEGLTESELVSWRVAEGDTVELNQVIAEVETAKALVELPSPFAGVIAKLYAEPGTTVLVGAPIAAFELADSGEPADVPMPDEDAPTDGSPQPVDSGRESVLVGYGPRVETGDRPKRRARKAAGPQALAPASGSDRLETSPAPRALSTPPVRKLARDLGVDLTTLTGTGDNGVVTREDVERASTGASAAPETRTTSQRSGDRETRTPIQGVRKHTAAAMVASAFTAPHASEFLTIDVTPTMELIDTLKASSQFSQVRLNLLAVVAKAVCFAVGRNPSVNSRWDDEAQQIVQFNYVNLGIAAATPRGLMVPNIKDADTLDLIQLAGALAELVETAKAGRTGQAELGGGTISITNIGVFGIDAGTPILPPGEAMILALGAVKRMPWEHKGEIALRQVLTLSISFDHRLVDGEQASRFLADVGRILANPASLIAMV
ncbi:dihydrolipoamide acetyltransferase family protein [Cryobacterium sp. BB307]|uniref:dihydrolipoamide acetyltransferase family protein n=1 Tax=Cryobacterium sp. BB307 TaxID=2716317 RepID=UPI0014453773|nr:dihydrolipoamide acetyltransferase family protein [Cryobacterium sp. BB307]